MKRRDSFQTMLYGRARRINLAKKIGIVCGIILILLLFIGIVVKTTTEKKELTGYAIMRNYFNQKGYICEMIEKDGGVCHSKMLDTNSAVKSSVYYAFTRYDEGFTYLLKSDTYSVEIRHIVNTYNDITLKTTSEALGRDKNMTYYCKTDNSVFGTLKTCETSEGFTVKNEVYLGAVEQAIMEVNNIIDNSGHKRDKLVDSYVWEEIRQK